MSILFSELQVITGGGLEQFTGDLPVEHIFNDSRNDLRGKESLFFAIHGRNYNGHDFILYLYERGIRNFVTEEEVDLTNIPQANVLRVSSSVEAMQQITAYKRNKLSLEIIGITGSNGKTIVKEWLYGLISPYRKCVKTPASFNSQIGVPLSVWQAGPAHDLGLFEAGISKKGEMEKLEPVIRPTVGIFTNIGTAHDAGFKDQQEKAEEKAKLFVNCETVIYCKDHPIVDRTIKSKSLPGLSWGEDPSSHVVIYTTETGSGKTDLSLAYKNEKFKVSIPFTDRASLENAMHCIVYMCYRGYSLEQINKGLAQLSPLKMRLEYKKGINRCMIIDDTYNNDLVGLGTAVEYLNRHAGERSTVLILSDILQSGKSNEALYSQVNDIILKGKIDKFIGIGPDISTHQNIFSHGDAQYFPGTDTFLGVIEKQTFNDNVILIKGARPFTFEKIVERLELQAHGTVMEINLKALLSNLYYYKGVVGKGVKIMAMLKALAYGSGSHEVAEVLSQQGIDYFGVAYADEGISLRKHGIKTPVMVMNSSENVFRKLIDYQLEPEIYSLQILESFATFLDGASAGIHIKFDTGMFRLGFSTDDIENLIYLLRSNPNIRVKSIFSHLAASDMPDHDGFTHAQAKLL
ncbi:MAG: alanine racemase, partial [Cyclobacteriaceae bacterium]|nr:alanine racemase [Cyclobacteriaceae bacterium]